MLLSYDDKIELLKEKINKLENDKDELKEKVEILEDENKDLKEIIKENNLDF